jgi:hypothetical protein
MAIGRQSLEYGPGAPAGGRRAQDPLRGARRSRGQGETALLAALLCALLFTAVAWGFVGVELRGDARSPSSPMAGDLLSHYHVTLQHSFAWLRAGTLPLWNPYQSCGAPLAAASHQGFVYPLYLPYLFLDAAAAFEVHLVLHLALACLGVTLLCRHWRLGWAASIVAGLVYGYQGSMMIKVFFPDFLASAAWMPWTFLAVDLIFERPSARRCAGLAAVVSLSLLGGHGLQFLYFTAWALVPLLAVRSHQVGARMGGRALARAAAVLAGGAALGVLLAGVRLLPLAELLLESWRPPGQFTLDFLGTAAMRRGAFVQTLFSPAPPPIPRLPFSPVDAWRQAYVGIVPLLLAGFGLVTWRRRRLALALAAAGAAAALYSLGTQAFLYPIVFRLPGGNWFRGIDRVLFVFGFAIAVLAGAGLDRLLAPGDDTTAPGRGVRLRIAGVLASGALILALGLRLGEPAGRLGLVAYAGAGAALLAGVASSAPRRALRAAIVAALALLITADLWHAQRFAGALPSALGAYHDRYADVFDAIRSRQGYDRTYIWSSFGWGHPLFFYSDIAKAGLIHGIYLPTDYEPLGGQRLADYLSALGAPIPLPIGPIGYVGIEPRADNIGLLKLLGVRFFVMDDAQEARLQREYPALLAGAQRILHRGGVSLYEYQDAMPRAFIAPQAAVVPADQMLEHMRGADLRTRAFVEDPAFRGLPPESARAPAGRAEITQYEPNRVVVETDSATSGLLVLTDQYYPGWHASLDGAPATLYRTDFLFRGVVVPAGQHRVEFTYRPLSWILGAAGSVLGLVILVLLLRVGR